MERPYAGMGYSVAAASVEFRGPAARLRQRRSLEQQTTRACDKGRATGARLRADRNAEEQRHRIYHRLLCCRHRFRDDLAHLVDGRSGSVRRICDAACLRIPPSERNRGASGADCPVRSGLPSGSCSMNISVAIDSVPQDALPSASEAGPAPKRIVVAYGFWIFLLSDIVMFSALFASYAVLVHSTAGGPTGAQLFNQVTVAIETACLLVSSYTCGLMSLAINSRRYLRTYLGALITFALGAAFLTLEIREFASMIAIGATPERSAFLSAFFTLVGCHGLHVTLGLIWLAVMMVQVAVMGFNATVQRRLLCFSLFWHALDIVWVGLFTVVYLMGVSP